MAEKPVMRDSLSRIEEKIKSVEEAVSFLGSDVIFESQIFEVDEHNMSEYFAFKLQVLTLYSIYKELGCSESGLASFRRNASWCLEVEDPYSSVDACVEVSWDIAPFWEFRNASGYHLYGKDELPDRVEEAMILATIDRFSDILLGLNYSLEEVDVMRTDEELYRLAAAECFYAEEVESSFYFLKSKLLPYYFSFLKSMGTSERRAFKRRKKVKRLDKLLDNIYNLIKPNLKNWTETTFAEGFYIFSVGDDACAYDCSLVAGCVNFVAGLNANIIDLCIFALDEELHFLPEEYAGRSNEIFADYISKECICKIS